MTADWLATGPISGTQLKGAMRTLLAVVMLTAVVGCSIGQEAHVPCRSVLDQPSYQAGLQQHGRGYVVYSRARNWCHWSHELFEALDNCNKQASDCIVTATGRAFYKEPSGPAYQAQVRMDRELYNKLRRDLAALERKQSTERSGTPPPSSPVAGSGVAGQPLGAKSIKDMVGCVHAVKPPYPSPYLDLRNDCPVNVYVLLEDYYMSNSMVQSCNIPEIAPGGSWGAVKREAPARFWACEATRECLKYLWDLKAKVCS